MSVTSIVIWLVIGAVAGWLAGLLVKGYGFGVVGNIVVGIIGAVIGGWIFGLLNLGASLGIVGAIISATVGAVVLLLVLKLFKRTGVT